MKRLAAICAVALAVIVLGALAVRTTSGQERSEPVDPIDGRPTPNPTEPGDPGEPEQPAPDTPVPTAVVAPTPEPTALPSDSIGQSLPDLPASIDVAPASLGTFVIAKPQGGIQTALSRAETAWYEIPVYDTPFGEFRRLGDFNEVDGVRQAASLINRPGDQGVLALRVIAGGPTDNWIQVQAPSRPHNRYVWVRSSDFNFGFTTKRIEIDLAGPGKLQLFDGDELLIETDIVQGRDTRETPVHVTYIETGVRGRELSPAYGTAILAMASFSEELGTFGGGGLPSNYLHGTNQAELMGQRVSSGEIRVPNETLDFIIEEIEPGTPVLMFDSSGARAGRQEILDEPALPAETRAFRSSYVGATSHSITGIRPHLWVQCPAGSNKLSCRNNGPILGESAEELDRWITTVAVAKPGAGVAVDGISGLVIPVYDEPGGAERMLVHRSEVSFVDRRYPLRHPRRNGEPLVLRVLEGDEDAEWIRVQAPISPQRRSIWVRSEDFEFQQTTRHFEIDLAGEGSLSFFEDGGLVVSSPIVSGRESRPTVLTDTYIDLVTPGPLLSPAYGPYVISTPTFSEALDMFGGDRLPNQAIHGTNQPELMGQRVSSGNVRLPNELVAFLAELPGGMIGARVVIFDSTDIGIDAAIARLRTEPWQPANTVAPDADLEVGEPLF